MKVLFAINNDNDLNAIIKKYQKDYKEILSYKNVYYFNAIFKELQKDKTYDRVVISEDLEPFANNNYEIIDKFLLEKLEKIIAEAKKINGEKIDIILICTNRRNKSDEIINKYFKMGINNAILKQDRNIDQVCKLINRPKNEILARQYYGIRQENLANQVDDENYVSEAEVQNIIMHYRRIGRDEDKYVDSFNNIVTQYTDAQLRIIINYLPIQVRAVLEEKSPKYQQLITFSKNISKPKSNLKEQEKIGVKMLESSSSKEKINRPIVIPSNIKNVTKKIKSESLAKKDLDEEIEVPHLKVPKIEEVQDFEVPEIEEAQNLQLPEIEEIEELEIPKIEEIKKDEVIQKRGRGRPRKNVEVQTPVEEKPKRGRGRPRKNIQPQILEENTIKNEDEDIDLFSLNDEETKADNDENIDLFSLNDELEEKNEIDLFSIEDEEENNEVDLFSLDDEVVENDEIDLFSVNDEEKNKDVDLFSMSDVSENEENVLNVNNNKDNEDFTEKHISQRTSNKSVYDFTSILTADKKVMAFVGTTKNGTSFVVNNVAALLSSMGISVAILDMTKSKNAYYIYTNNEESLRNIAKDCIENLEKGIDNGIKVDKNLSVYVSLPGKNEQYEDFQTMMATLVQNHSVILIDADFNTPDEIFEMSQEIYLVQSMDVLTIQPLTAFLRNLKSKGILKEEKKLKIILNKAVKVKNLSNNAIIGGMAYYNDPAMSFMTELFNKNNVGFWILSFELQNYEKYLGALVNCKIDLNGYTKKFMYELNELINETVYPRLGRVTYKPMGNKKEHFSRQVNDTLNKMRNNY